MFTGKTVYVITTGATKSKSVSILLDSLRGENANCILIPTPMCCSMMDWDSVEGYQVKKGYDDNGKLPEEDIVIVAPCTFNSFSKIANGIADNYAMSILHAAIGKGKHVIIAPAMDYWYFNHPVVKENFAKINSFNNVSIVYPEFIYNDGGELEKITMAPWGKILDNICHKYTKIRYSDKRIESDISGIIEEHFPEFYITGQYLQENHYSNGAAGFIAKRINEGVLITSSGSSLGNLSREDITIIHNWKDRVVSWSGYARPSSETPLVVEILEAFPNMDVIVHGHCKDITYNPKTLKYNSVEYLRYGEWSELYKIKPMLETYQKGIMKLHGEIILAGDFKEALNIYLDTYKETL